MTDDPREVDEGEIAPDEKVEGAEDLPEDFREGDLSEEGD